MTAPSELEAVWRVMRDLKPRTATEITTAVHARFGQIHTTAGITARVRDLRKSPYDKHIICYRRNGAYYYQLLPQQTFAEVRIG